MINRKTIAVHGATGSQGAPVATLLTIFGHRVRSLSRASGADLLDRASLRAAYDGADAVVLQLPLVYDERALQMGENAARAAEAAGVPHLVINTGGPLPPEPIGVPFLDARVLAASADVPRVTVLQPATTYMENLSAPWAADRIARDGVVAYPVPAEAPVRWVATADVAVAIERAIEREVTGWFALPGVPRSGLELADDARRRDRPPGALGDDCAADVRRPVAPIPRRPRRRRHRRRLRDARRARRPRRSPTAVRHARRSAGRRATSRRGRARCRGRCAGRMT